MTALFKESFWGAGFDELKRYIRTGSDFCKDVALIIQERAEAEGTYAKQLSRLSAKLSKAADNNFGSLVEGWKKVAEGITLEAELHKNLSQALLEEISKPMKQLVETQHRARRPIEQTVDKSLQKLREKRADENKAKKVSYDCAKSLEKVEESVKSGKAKSTEKDVLKLEKKQKSLVEGLLKADKNYCDACEAAESARQEWDVAVGKACNQLQALEEERIARMSDYLNLYSSNISVLGPKLTQMCEQLHTSVRAVDLQGDVREVASRKGSTPNIPEQVLIDCYAEDKTFSLNPERRKLALQNYLLNLRQSIERERKGKEGVERLVEVYRERPNFADKDAQDETRLRLLQVIFMMNFLEANHYKIASHLAEMDKEPKPSYRFAKYIEQARDKQGMNVSTLKLPLSLAVEGKTGYDATNITLGALTSTADDPYDQANDFDDDFDDHLTVIGQCRALYPYDMNKDDELTIREGDVITIYEKLDADWWKGQLGSSVGLFPASYVQEI